MCTICPEMIYASYGLCKSLRRKTLRRSRVISSVACQNDSVILTQKEPSAANGMPIEIKMRKTKCLWRKDLINTQQNKIIFIQRHTTRYIVLCKMQQTLFDILATTDEPPNEVADRALYERRPTPNEAMGLGPSVHPAALGPSIQRNRLLATSFMRCRKQD